MIQNLEIVLHANAETTEKIDFLQSISNGTEVQKDVQGRQVPLSSTMWA